jgi:hypothetical protein
MADQEQYTLTPRGDYIHLVTKGELNIETLDAPANAALAMAAKTKITKLLDDVRYVDNKGVSIPLQAKGVGILWKLRAFTKVAILFKDQDLGRMFFSTLEAMHISGRFRGFYNEAEAIAWLEADNE